MSDQNEISGEDRPAVIGAADVGSNSIKGRIVLAAGHTRKVLADVRYPVRLGRGTFSAGTILKEDIAGAVTAFRDFVDRCTAAGASRIIAVGTSALREAANTQEFTRRVAEATGLTVRVVSGEEEARLVAASAVDFMDGQNHYLVVDIGGGSTEVMHVAPGGNLSSAVSLQLGSVRLAEELGMPERFSEKDVAALAARVRTALAAAAMPVAPHAHAIGTGGTIRTLLDLCANAGVPAFSREHLAKLLAGMTGKSVGQLVTHFGYDEKRAQIIVPGTVILSELMQFYNLAGISVHECGVRDGLINEALQS